MNETNLSDPIPVRFTADQRSRIQSLQKKYRFGRAVLIRLGVDLALDEWERSGVITIKAPKNTEQATH
ncbi:MAG: hypothetical protein LBV12_07165 [Puniceicoccales bacterium]|nr:hypothetical protein [Puniceicoccales bacterium]